jgi:hypothetical protein
MTGPPWSSESARGQGAVTCGREGHAVADALIVCSVHDSGQGWGMAVAAKVSCEGSLKGQCRSLCENGGSLTSSRRGERGLASAGRHPRGSFNSVGRRNRGRVQDMKFVLGKD